MRRWTTGTSGISEFSASTKRPELNPDVREAAVEGGLFFGEISDRRLIAANSSQAGPVGSGLLLDYS
jgi:hypothetical protein